MKHTTLFLGLTLFASVTSIAQLDVAQHNGHHSAILDLTNDQNKGFLPPRLTQSDIDFLDTQGPVNGPANGLMVYNIDSNCLQFNMGDKVNPIWHRLNTLTPTSPPATPSPPPTSTLATAWDPPVFPNGVDGVAYSETEMLTYSGGTSGTQESINTSLPNGINLSIPQTQIANTGGTAPVTVTGPSNMAVGTHYMSIPFGGTVRMIEVEVDPGLVSNWTRPILPEIYQNQSFSQVVTIPYSGGNGGRYSAITSTNNQGAQIQIEAGQFAIGSGTIQASITAPEDISPGNNYINVTIGGVTKSILLKKKTYGIFASPSGQVWMDRNLGANDAAASPEDSNAFGDLYQWGRATDGHEKIFRVTGDESTSSVKTFSSNSFYAVNGAASRAAAGDEFVAVQHSMGNPNYWLAGIGENSWNTGSESSPTKTQYDPCPSGFRIPTKTEWENELPYMNDPSSSPFDELGLANSGSRRYNTQSSSYAPGSLSSTNLYWSSSYTISFAFKRPYALVVGSNAQVSTRYVAEGAAVRCIQD